MLEVKCSNLGVLTSITELSIVLSGEPTLLSMTTARTRTDTPEPKTAGLTHAHRRVSNELVRFVKNVVSVHVSVPQVLAWTDSVLEVL